MRTPTCTPIPSMRGRPPPVLVSSPLASLADCFLWFCSCCPIFSHPFACHRHGHRRPLVCHATARSSDSSLWESCSNRLNSCASPHDETCSSHPALILEGAFPDNSTPHMCVCMRRTHQGRTWQGHGSTLGWYPSRRSSQAAERSRAHPAPKRTTLGDRETCDASAGRASYGTSVRGIGQR